MLNPHQIKPGPWPSVVLYTIVHSAAATRRRHHHTAPPASATQRSATCAVRRHPNRPRSCPLNMRGAPNTAPPTSRALPSAPSCRGPCAQPPSRGNCTRETTSLPSYFAMPHPATGPPPTLPSSCSPTPNPSSIGPPHRRRAGLHYRVRS
jgi:hypothetical protein